MTYEYLSFWCPEGAVEYQLDKLPSNWRVHTITYIGSNQFHILMERPTDEGTV